MGALQGPRTTLSSSTDEVRRRDGGCGSRENFSHGRSWLRRSSRSTTSPYSSAPLRELINATAGMFVVGEAGREEAVELVESLVPTLVLIDVFMPGVGGVEAAREIEAAHSSTIVALLSTTHPDELSCQGGSCPADALIWKSDLRPSVLEEIWQRYRPQPAAYGRAPRGGPGARRPPPRGGSARRACGAPPGCGCARSRG